MTPASAVETVTVKPRGKHYVQPRGYAHLPGTGPKGETCGLCVHAVRFGRFMKCEKARAKWTHGRGSDVLARAPACSYWAANGPGPESKQGPSAESKQRNDGGLSA